MRILMFFEKLTAPKLVVGNITARRIGKKDLSEKI